MMRPAAPARIVAASLIAVALAACSSAPLVPWSTDTPPIVLVPVAQAGVQDQRARFREIFCAVLEARPELPDHRPCEDALTRMGGEGAAGGVPVQLGPSHRGLVAEAVPGFGYDCFESWLDSQSTVATHLRPFGYDLSLVRIEGLSSSARNARLIRDALMARPAEAGPPRIVLIGYSKGTPDILEALENHPEIRSRVAAFVSIAGTVGGSPLAIDAERETAEWLTHVPGATCSVGDRGAVASLRPDVRRAWLAAHPLPTGLRYYSLVTMPKPERISSILKRSYSKLSQVDARNDSQALIYDQVLPAGSLLGYLNADHWAAAVPIGRTHSTVASLFVTENAYPREALIEAVLRFVEEDLDKPR
ncbi:MAG TPA: hypothetical protein VMU47_02875 [Caldimonas sp.]|nr:hypothetical protein [Caldimonas sp.]